MVVCTCTWPGMYVPMYERSGRCELDCPVRWTYIMYIHTHTHWCSCMSRVSRVKGSVQVECGAPPLQTARSSQQARPVNQAERTYMRGTGCLAHCLYIAYRSRNAETTIVYMCFHYICRSWFYRLFVCVKDSHSLICAFVCIKFDRSVRRGWRHIKYESS